MRFAGQPPCGRESKQGPTATADAQLASGEAVLELPAVWSARHLVTPQDLIVVVQRTDAEARLCRWYSRTEMFNGLVWKSFKKCCRSLSLRWPAKLDVPRRLQLIGRSGSAARRHG